MSSIASSFWCDVVLCVLFIVLIIYYWIKNRYSYWNKKGVFSPTPKIPYGNTETMVKRESHLGETFQNIYKETKSKPYVGVFMMFTPTLVINDLDLLKLVLTKDFVHFSDHGLPYNEEIEPLTGHLFNLGGAKWKKLRAKLTPAFTSNKTRIMFEKIEECAGEMTSYLDKEIQTNEPVDVKEVLATFGNDVIASCAFGIECNTFKNPDEKFRKMGKRIFSPTPFEHFVHMIDFFIPHLFTRLKVMILSKDIENFFYGIVEETVNYRQKHNVSRNDFMQLLIQLKNTGSISDEGDDEKSNSHVDDGTKLTMAQLAAQVFVFFIAGFETSSSTASFALYELALNPEVQTELAKEIDEMYAKYKGKLTYDSLAEMTYLTKVIEETMRKYPPLPVIFRICTKEYTLPDTNIKIEKDTPVMIPIYGIQRDPEIFPNPDKFDPERFTPENKATRHHFSYLPFGEGPRICIGSRFGMMQTKLGLATFLSKYEVSVSEKTAIPMDYDKRSFVLSSNGGLWLNVKRRNK